MNDVTRTSKEKLPDWLRRWYALKGEPRFREAADEIERLQKLVEHVDEMLRERNSRVALLESLVNRTAPEPRVDLKRYFQVKSVAVADEPKACRLDFHVGVQTIPIGPEYCEDRDHADWWIDVICKALQNVIAACSAPPPAPVAPTWTCPNCETADEFTVTNHGPDDLGAVYPVMICRICDTTVSDYRAEQIRAICQNNPSVRLAPTPSPDAVDAARYRFLRDNEGCKVFDEWLHSKHLDDAIDAELFGATATKGEAP
jgi:hypothetical protein